MNQYLTSNDIDLIRSVIADTLFTPRNYNRSLRSYRQQLDVILTRIRDIENYNEQLLVPWEKERKFAEEWNIEVPEHPILKNIEFSKEDIEIIKETFQETKKEYPTDDLISTYVGGDIQAVDNMLKKLENI
jgi:hypothetical protein